jgi:superfamily II DNA or RNA helicase
MSMAYQKISHLFERIQFSLDNNNISFSPKIKQIQCFEHLLNGEDVIAVLPTGFGKSILFQLLHDIIPPRSKNENNKNIVIVVCPLNSIIEDQLKYLQKNCIPSMELKLERGSMGGCIPSLFQQDVKEIKNTIPEKNAHSYTFNIRFNYSTYCL